MLAVTMMTVLLMQAAPKASSMQPPTGDDVPLPQGASAPLPTGIRGLGSRKAIIRQMLCALKRRA